jgi:hypothetical protein
VAASAPYFKTFGPPIIARTTADYQAVSPVSWPWLLGTGSQQIVMARSVRSSLYFANLSATATVLICPAQDFNNNPLAAGGPGSIPVPPGAGLPIEESLCAWNGAATAPNTPFTVLEFFVGGITGAVGFGGSGGSTPPVNTNLTNDGGWLIVSNVAGWPSSSVSLPAGALWSNGALATIVPGVTPDPSAPPVFFGNITATALLALGGGNLPLTNPGPGTGQLYNQGGVVAIA